MSLTLGVLASVLALFPGLVLIAAFNYRSTPGGARRPEMPLTAISALTLAVFVSLFVHLLAYFVTNLALAFAVACHSLFGINFGRIISNPIGAGLAALGGSRIGLTDAIGLGIVLLSELFAVANFVFHPGFRLGFERTDFYSQGWVFEHITRPALNGYTPVGHVYTSTMSGRFGIAYKGAVTDIRQDDKGQILAIALSRPERFLYEVGDIGSVPSTTRRWWQQASTKPVPAPVEFSIRHHGKDYTGGVVSLDARVINNIVIHCIADSLIREIDETVGEPAQDPIL